MPGEAEPLSHDMIILYVTVMLVRTLIIVYFCPRVSVQGLFTGRVGTSNQLGIAGFGAGCILGECLHGNASQFCVCVRVFFFSSHHFAPSYTCTHHVRDWLRRKDEDYITCLI